MSTLIKCINDSIKIESYTFMIMDSDGVSNRPDDALSMDELTVQFNSSNDLFAATANLAMIKSREFWHVADVALELWDAEPPNDSDDWTECYAAEIYSSSGKLRLVQMLGGESRKVLDLKERNSTWSVCVSVRPGSGRRKTSGKPPRGIESYRFQFWRSIV